MSFSLQECYWHGLYQELWSFQSYFQLKVGWLHFNKQQNMCLSELKWTYELWIHQPFLIIAKYYQHLLFHLGQVILKILDLIILVLGRRKMAEWEQDMQSSLQLIIWSSMTSLSKKKCASSPQRVVGLWYVDDLSMQARWMALQMQSHQMLYILLSYHHFHKNTLKLFDVK